jgi:hypothetical protein
MSKILNNVYVILIKSIGNINHFDDVLFTDHFNRTISILTHDYLSKNTIRYNRSFFTGFFKNDFYVFIEWENMYDIKKYIQILNNEYSYLNFFLQNDNKINKMEIFY